MNQADKIRVLREATGMSMEDAKRIVGVLSPTKPHGLVVLVATMLVAMFAGFGWILGEMLAYHLIGLPVG